jgi:hypothetical protein
MMRGALRRFVAVDRRDPAAELDVVEPTQDAGIRGELDNLVITMELTLISIIQGVALYFLADSARAVVVAPSPEHLPYILSGLLMILLFWSRSLIHTLTVIRWPLEFGHNFFYIGCTLVEAIMLSQLASPANWYLLGAVYSAAVWSLFAFDLRMIRGRMEGSGGGASLLLYELVHRDQVTNLRFWMPLTTSFYALSAAAVRLRPDLFLDRRWHLALAAIQLVAGALYLGFVLRFYGRLSPLILAHYREARMKRSATE